MSKTLKEKMKIAQAIREGGHTERMHGVPHLLGCSVAKHSWNMITLLYVLHPSPSRFLVLAAAFHDVAERWSGDTPAPAKKWMNPQLGVELEKVESAVDKALGINFELGIEDKKWLDAVDRLELLMYCADDMATGNMHVFNTYNNCLKLLTEDWVPEEVREFTKNYTWSRTSNIIDGEKL